LRYIENIIGATLHPVFIGEAGRFRSASNKVSRIFHICRASPISGVRIAAPIVLAQHKKHERIGEARTSMRRASPIVIKLAY
jgi:hypothetical protein